ncbi:MAG: aminotransferase class IV [Acidimicrobiia bacterium]
MRVLIDGIAVPEGEAGVSALDWGLQRGFGAFEVIRAYGGRPFRVGPHLGRLQRSLAALEIPMPDRDRLEEWVAQVAASGGDCQVRVMVTGGGRDPLLDVPSRTVVLWEPVPEFPQPFRLLPMAAPWHPAGIPWALSGVKWLSYAANMASTDAAKRAGFDDALLLSSDGLVLEGPTFTVAWISGGTIETPSLELGLLASITRDVLMECAARLEIPSAHGVFPLERLLTADEVLALSTVKEVTPVGAVGDTTFDPGPITAKLGGVFHDIVVEETG